MLDVVVLFFLLGVFARVAGSDLRLPEPLYETLSIYLLLAIGLKGGLELSRQPLAALAPEIVACMALGLAIPFVMYPALRALKFAPVDAAALGAHYGSVSVVTFAAASAALARAGLPHEAHAALWVAVMEAPGLVAGILLARRAEAGPARWGALHLRAGGGRCHRRTCAGHPCAALCRQHALQRGVGAAAGALLERKRPR